MGYTWDRPSFMSFTRSSGLVEINLLQGALVARKLRFSVRNLAIASTLVVTLTWWLATPTTNANRFVRAINAGDFRQAQSLIAVPRSRIVLLGGVDDLPVLVAKAEIQDLVWWDLVRGRRSILFDVRYKGESQPLALHFRMEGGVRGIHAVDLERLRHE